MKDRYTDIINLVSSRQRIEVNELSELLGVTTATMRRDLTYLSEKGILRRERGYALLRDTNDINYRMAFYYEEKRRIAQYAASLVDAYETIILESGSTCALFAEELVRARKKITFITNSAYIANYIQETSDENVILLGGTFQKHSRATVGPMTKECVRPFRVDKIFAGIDGFSMESGFMGDNIDRSDTIRAMAASAKHIYILAESNKFKISAAVPYFSFGEVYELITDSGIEEKARERMSRAGIRVTVV